MNITFKTDAKINLSLDITGRRADGYHLVNTVMQSVLLQDKITVEKSDTITVSTNVAGINNEDNIAYKAAVFFFQKAGISGGANIVIEKNIPMSAGLGGGSGNAAGVLIALNKIYGNILSYAELIETGKKIGADVPYFFYGGTAYATGIGDEIEKIEEMPECYIVIAKNGEKKSTKEMYDIIDNAENSVHPDTKNIINAVKHGDYNKLCGLVGNSFSSVWDFSKLSDIMYKCGADAVSLSGSGPSVFALFSNKGSALNCLGEFNKMNIEAYFTKPTKKSVHF